jgi:hypothetical protein
VKTPSFATCLRTGSRLVLRGAGLLLVLAAVGGTVQARGPEIVPEIDPGSITGALALLGGGLLLLTDRLSRKK